MRKYLSILCIVVSLLLITITTSYAESPKSTTEPDRTFTLTIDSKEAIINLPKDFPDMNRVVNRKEHCWDASICAATFCIISTGPTHGHVRFFYSYKGIVALGWVSKDGEFRWWLYEKGVSTEVSYKILEEALLD